MKSIFLLLFLLMPFAYANSVSPDIVAENGELLLEIHADQSGVYKFVPLYSSDYQLMDLLTLDCVGSICYEPKTTNYIAAIPPGYYFFSVYSYDTGEWEEIPFYVEPFTSFITNDTSYINARPFIGGIPSLRTPLHQKEFQKFLNLEEYATDRESDALNFSLETQNKIISCFLEGSWLVCGNPTALGEETLNVSVSDSDKSSSTSFKVIVYEVKENRNPIAVAGDDINVVPNQQFILDGSGSYDFDDNLPTSAFHNGKSVYTWKLFDGILGEGKKIALNFSKTGRYEIFLEVIDSENAVGVDSIVINVEEKMKCRETPTLYYPKDTICENKWLSKEGEKIRVNTEGYSCDLFEVCNEDLDYIIEDAINCCDGSALEDERFFLCQFANTFSQGKSKRCEALYLMQSFGSGAIYMQDYFEAEMCCYAVEELCANPNNFLKALPFPGSDTSYEFLNCQLGKNGKRIRGWWNSDTDMNQNNIALSDIPAHASIDLLSTGTCVDYAFGLTTALRKAGYSAEEIYAVESYDHAYNFVKLAGDEKYTIVDTTGNGYAFVLGGKPLGYDYCGKIQKCYNDLGRVECPKLKEIFTCENYEKFSWTPIVFIFLGLIIVIVFIWKVKKK